MKKSIKLFVYLLLIISIFIQCSEEEINDQNPGDSVDTILHNTDVNNIMKGLMVDNSEIKKGSISASSNPDEFKINKEIIYLVEGVKNRVYILYPANFIAKKLSVYLQVENAQEFLDIPYNEEESSDSIGVFTIEFDPGDLELPLSFNIKIMPKDENGDPADEFEREVIVEEKGAENCSILEPSPLWFWISSSIDGQFENAPGHPDLFGGTTQGCCIEGESQDCLGRSPNASIDYEGYYMIYQELVKFEDDGYFAGQILEEKRNLDYSESDFCSNTPAYVNSSRLHAFTGEYVYNQNNGVLDLISATGATSSVYLPELDLTVTEYDHVFVSPRRNYKIVSCHFLEERFNDPETGKEFVRMFERRGGTASGGWKWYD